jgi:UDP-4-amino-4,6-dideoxy-N-acetyl-beta-L-altrosamine transaminase
LIPYGRQNITEEDIEAVIEILRSDFLTQGPAVPRFETALKKAVQVPHAVAFSSATAALHSACLALGLANGDRLWTTPNTFVASANCGLYCGATVDFVDIDPHSRNMSVDALSIKLKNAEIEGTLPKIVIPVNFAGTSADLKPIRALADSYGFHIIEDASHAVGGKYRGFHVGSCEFSDITIFSFHPVKIVTTGEGGAATTRSSEIAHRLELLRSHGITRDPQKMEFTSQGAWYYEQIMLGFNYRMTDMQAALGASQLERLPSLINQRQLIARRYDNWLEGLPLILQSVPENVYSALHLYVVEINDATRFDRRVVFSSMRDAGIGVNVHYIPVHLQPMYRSLGFKKGSFPNAERYYERALTLPIYPDLQYDSQKYIAEKLKAILL